MAAWRSALRLLVVAALIAFEDMLSVPSCSISGKDDGDADHPDDLKVMMVADLLLQGSDAGYADLFFRDPYTSRFFRKSFDRLKPDMLIVLGDMSAKGSELTERKWLKILQQFQSMLGPFVSLPYFFVFGDRDIGECSKLDGKFVSQIASNLPGLDSAGCSAFQISNITFVSLNAVAMLCGNNDLRFNVEKVIERESLDLRSVTSDAPEEPVEPNETRTSFSNVHWRANAVASGSGPVLLLHFPLHWTTTNNFERANVLEERPSCDPCGLSISLDSSGINGAGTYELMHTLPPNATEYIFQSLKPRMVFSAHTHNFCDRTHNDGTHEVIVPAMTWATRGEPGFVVVTFRQNKVMTVSHCSLATESHVLMAYLFMFLLIIATPLVVRWSYSMKMLNPRHSSQNSDYTSS